MRDEKWNRGLKGTWKSGRDEMRMDWKEKRN